MLRLHQPLAVPVGLHERDAVLGQQIDEPVTAYAIASSGSCGAARRQYPVGASTRWDNEGWCAKILAGNRVGHEVRLSTADLVDGAEVIPPQAEVECELRSYLPVVLEVSREIHPLIVCRGDIGSEYAVGATRVAESIRIGLSVDGCWCRLCGKQHLSNAAGRVA